MDRCTGIVTYDYYTTTESGYGGELYNLKAVHLDPDGLNRTTTYRYTNYISGASNTEPGLLCAVADGLGHTTQYEYTICTPTDYYCIPAQFYVSHVTEASGVGSTIGDPADAVWYETIRGVDICVGGGPDAFWGHRTGICVNSPGEGNFESYDDSMNITSYSKIWANGNMAQYDESTYGSLGNILTHWSHGFSGQDTYTYYDESKYFQKSSVTDKLGHQSSFDYGSKDDPNIGNRGNVLWAQDATGHQATYTYNTSGQKTSETNMNGVVTRYTYGDQWGNLTRVVQDPTGLNRITTMTYDAAGRVTERIDPKGQRSTIAYNALGQPTTATFYRVNGTVEETVSYSYGINGRLQSTTDNRGTTSLSYVSGKDMVASVTDPVTGTISYTYDDYGNVATKTLPGGGQWTYSYDQYNPCAPKDDLNSVGRRLASIQDDAQHTVTYSTNIWGNVRYVQSNWGTGANSHTLRTDYSYETDPTDSYTMFRLGCITTTLKNGSAAAYVVNQNEYTYDNIGNRLTNTVSADTNKDGTLEQVRTEGYTYDSLSRLTNVNYGDGETQGYTFDPMGNRLTKTDGGTTNYTYNNANMLLTAGANNYNNDPNGNTLTGGGRTNTWDSENRLTQCSYNGHVSTYTYGSDGLRRKSVVDGETTEYALDGQSVVREMKRNTQGQLVNKATYLTGASGPVYRRDDVTGTYKWYVYDGHGNVVSEVDESGTPSAPIAFDVYGVPRSGDPGTSPNKFCGSLGHSSDAETGLVYMRARYMDPSLGRFVSEDSAGSGLNWFVYCENDPVNKVDSSGNASIYWMGWSTFWYSIGLGATFLAVEAALVASPVKWTKAQSAIIIFCSSFAMFAYGMSSVGLDISKGWALIGTMVGSYASMADLVLKESAAGLRSLAGIYVASCVAYSILLSGIILGDLAEEVQ